MKILGITGNIGSGKSVATAYLETLGAAVIDADQIGHQIIRRGEAAYEPLLAAFGESFLDVKGEFDRQALGGYVFADKSGVRRRQLNSITHPLIRDRIAKQLEQYADQGYRLAVIEAALLFEAEMTGMMDRVWLIAAPREELLQRVTRRDDTDEAIVIARLEGQMPIEEMMELADLVINNEGSIEQFQYKIKEQYDKLLKENS